MFPEKGKSYLTPLEQTRLSAYDKNRLLFKTQFDKMKWSNPGDPQREIDEKWINTVIRAPKFISTIAADFLFNEVPVIKTNSDAGDKVLASQVYTRTFQARLFPGALVQSYVGGVVIVLTVPVPKKPVLTLIDPKHYFPEIDPTTGQASAVELRYIVPVIYQDKPREVVYIERYTYKERGGVLAAFFGEKVTVVLETKIFLLTQNTETVDQELNLKTFDRYKGVQPKKELKDMSRIPVYYVPNVQEDLGHFGTSDYKGLEPLFHALNRRAKTNEHALEVHGSPKLAVPEQHGLFDEHGRKIKKSFDYYVVPSAIAGVGGSPFTPKYIQQILSTEDNLATMKYYFETILTLSDSAPVLFSTLGEGQNVPSGKALKIQLLRTLTMARRKSVLWGVGLWNAIEDALKIINSGHSLESIQFQDGLPQDIFDIIQQEIDKLEAGIQTQVEAIETVDGSDKTAATTKAGEIKAERKEASRNQVF